MTGALSLTAPDSGGGLRPQVLVTIDYQTLAGQLEEAASTGTLISQAAEIEDLAAQVDDNGGCYIVPAFSGLFAPYWRDDARGAIVGLTRYVDKHHIARAALEATAYQTREVLDAMRADSGVAISELRVDGGMVANELLMQFQADILDLDVVRPEVVETTALGAAYAAGIAVGFWEGQEELAEHWSVDCRWSPQMRSEERERLYRTWKKAVTRTFDWVDEDTAAPEEELAQEAAEQGEG